MHRKLWRALVIKWRLRGKSHQLKTGKQNWRIFSAFWVLIVAKNRSQRPHSSNSAYYYPHGSNLIYKVKGKGKRSMTLCSSNDLWHNKKAASIIGRAQYVYQDSKLVGLVACFFEHVKSRSSCSVGCWTNTSLRQHHTQWLAIQRRHLFINYCFIVVLPMQNINHIIIILWVKSSK